MFSNRQHIIFSQVETETQEEVLVDEEKKFNIIIYNDEVNTFDFVIETLIDVCEHEYEQATQCAYITHYKGKCDVKSGTYNFLEPKCAELLRRGLTAQIE